MIMCGHEGADDAAISHVHAGKKRGGAMTLIVVRHGSATSLLPRQPGLCAVQGLDLTLFIHRNHYRPSRGMEIQGHHIFQFLGKARVVAQLKPLHPVRFQTVRPPDAADGRRTHRSWIESTQTGGTFSTRFLPSSMKVSDQTG